MMKAMLLILLDTTLSRLATEPDAETFANLGVVDALLDATADPRTNLCIAMK
jgi:hypothetical protein